MKKTILSLLLVLVPLGLFGQSLTSCVVPAIGAGGVLSCTSGTFPTGWMLPWSQVTGAPTIPSPSSSTPNMDGTGSAGSSSAYSRGDHTHPTDTSRAGTGACSSGQYETADAAGGPSCAQVQYSQIGGTPSGSGAVYSTPFSFAMVSTDNTSITGSSPIVLVSNVGASNVTYEFSFSYAQTALGSGGCTTSNVFVMLCYTDADNGVAIGGNCQDDSEYTTNAEGRLWGFTAPQGNNPEFEVSIQTSFSAGNPGLGSNSRWTQPRFPIRVAAGSAVKLQVFQNNHNSCTTEPVFEATPLLFGPF